MVAVASRVSWADSEETPMTGGASSSAARPRWADIAEEDEEAGATRPPQQLAQATSCGSAPQRAEDADSICSTSACSDQDATERFTERFADVASDEEEAPASPAAPAARSTTPSAAAAASSAHQPRTRADKGGGAAAPAAAQKGRNRGRQWGAQRHYDGWWKEGAAEQGRWDSWKEASWQPRGKGRWENWQEAPWQPRSSKGKHQKPQGATGKRQCQFTIGIEEEPRFSVVRRLLGSHGKHVKRIAEESGAKLRLRGRGSGFKEGPEQEESTDPLMLCVSAPDPHSYDVCVQLLREHLQEIYEQHRSMFLDAAHLQIDMHEGPREGSY